MATAVKERAVAAAEEMAADPPPEGDAPAQIGGSGGPGEPKRTLWVDLPGDYGEAGMRMRVWTNYPRAVSKALHALKGIEAFRAAVRDIVVEHNGWVDADGNPLPPAGTDELWWGDGVSDELVGVVLAVLDEVTQRYPKEVRQSGGS